MSFVACIPWLMSLEWVLWLLSTDQVKPSSNTTWQTIQKRNDIYYTQKPLKNHIIKYRENSQTLIFFLNWQLSFKYQNKSLNSLS